MLPVSPKTMLKCFLRSYLTGSAFNTRGMQNIGLAYAIDPGLKEIHKDPVKLQKARRRHVKLYSTHHLWNPLLIGLFISLEKQISRGLFPPQAMPKVKSTLVFTLSAIGDSFYSGTLLITWSLLTIILFFLGLYGLAIALGIVFFLCVQIFKLIIFHKAATQGLIFINNLKKWDLINWAGRLKIVNSLLVPAFWLVIWPFNWHLFNFILISIFSLLMAYLYRTFIWTREILFIFLLALCFLAPQFFSWMDGKF
jgi:mannose/fructose/N-acetylgalactosamine-specific phosphotransferase system component IID